MVAAPVRPLTFTVPSESAFGDQDFLPAADLVEAASMLIERHQTKLGHLKMFEVVYLWKKSGGKSNGKGTYGKTQKPSGVLTAFTDAHYVIWLAADHVANAGFDDRQVEALLFHEMLHTGADDETMAPILIPHDVEMFRAEVEEYGLWEPQLREVAPAFKQASLFDGGA